MAYNYYPEYYVGVKTLKSGERLAFLTQVTNDSSFAKRQSSVDGWLNCGAVTKKSFKLQNAPQTGFKFVDCVRRYATSNKLLRIEDPRGWEFELSIENLADIMPDINIINGVIKEELIYTKTPSGNIALAPPSRVSIPPSKAKKIDFAKLSPMDKYRYQNQDYTYLGKIDVGYAKYSWGDDVDRIGRTPNHIDIKYKSIFEKHNMYIAEFKKNMTSHKFVHLIDFSTIGAEEISGFLNDTLNRASLINTNDMKRVIPLGKSSEDFTDTLKMDIVYVNWYKGYAFDIRYKEDIIKNVLKRSLESVYQNNKVFKVAQDIYIIGAANK